MVNNGELTPSSTNLTSTMDDRDDHQRGLSNSHQESRAWLLAHLTQVHGMRYQLQKSEASRDISPIADVSHHLHYTVLFDAISDANNLDCLPLHISK